VLRRRRRARAYLATIPRAAGRHGERAAVRELRHAGRAAFAGLKRHGHRVAGARDERGDDPKLAGGAVERRAGADGDDQFGVPFVGRLDRNEPQHRAVGG